MSTLLSTPKCTIYKPPVSPQIITPSIFLAGSIEQNAAERWQADLTLKLSDLPIVIFNPRRDKWDGDLKQDISNPDFKEQVD